MVERKMEKSMEEMDLEYIANSDLEWSKYKNKTIFVTGATGLIGSLLVKAFAYYNCLHQGNIKIIGLIRNEEKAKRIYGKWYNNYSQYYSIQDDGAASGPDDTNFIYGNKECIGFGSR